MTKKDFKQMASIIAKIEDIKTREQMAKQTAIEFAKANPRFKKDIYFQACNVVI